MDEKYSRKETGKKSETRPSSNTRIFGVDYPTSFIPPNLPRDELDILISQVAKEMGDAFTERPAFFRNSPKA